MTKIDTLAATLLARLFHETYERLAPQFGYETRKESAVQWDAVPDNNKRLMVAVCAEILSAAAPDPQRGDTTFTPPFEIKVTPLPPRFTRVTRRMQEDAAKEPAGETITYGPPQFSRFDGSPKPVERVKKLKRDVPPGHEPFRIAPPIDLPPVEVHSLEDARHIVNRWLAHQQDFNVRVCSACKRACCWQGYFLCEEFKTASSELMLRSKLYELRLESDRYWVRED